MPKKDIDGQVGSLPGRTVGGAGGDEPRKFGASSQRSGKSSEEE